jgi:hypothetical protein
MEKKNGFFSCGVRDVFLVRLCVGKLAYKLTANPPNSIFLDRIIDTEIVLSETNAR